MNAHDSLLDNFSSMHEEFSSSNNRMKRGIDEIFDLEFKDVTLDPKYKNSNLIKYFG